MKEDDSFELFVVVIFIRYCYYVEIYKILG